jgi:hypothetical protein
MFQVAYIVSLPFTIYALVKAVFLRILTEKTDADAWEKPPLRSPGTPAKPARESSYIIERKKVLWVLSKYYTYRDKLEQMHKQMEEGTFSMTLEETQAVFEEMPYYVEITPADSFTGEPLRKAKRLTVLLFLLLGAGIVIEIWKTLGSLFSV